MTNITTHNCDSIKKLKVDKTGLKKNLTGQTKTHRESIKYKVAKTHRESVKYKVAKTHRESVKYKVAKTHRESIKYKVGKKKMYKSQDC